MFKSGIMSCLTGNHPRFGRMILRMRDVVGASVEIQAGEADRFMPVAQQSYGRPVSRGEYNLPFGLTLVSFRYNEGLGQGEVPAPKRAVLFNRVEGSAFDEVVGFFYAQPYRTWGPNIFGHRLYDDKSETMDLFMSSKRLGPCEMQKELTNCVGDVTMAVAILNVLSCKNVHLSMVDPPRALNKKRVKNGKLPLYRYHVLEVDLGAGRAQSGKAPRGNAGIMPVHLCRGHFKEYTEERPLFGRVTGRFWWQPCARGNAQRGVVIKDYKIRGKQDG